MSLAAFPRNGPHVMTRWVVRLEFEFRSSDGIAGCPLGSNWSYESCACTCAAERVQKGL